MWKTRGFQRTMIYKWWVFNIDMLKSVEIGGGVSHVNTIYTWIRTGHKLQRQSISQARMPRRRHCMNAWALGFPHGYWYLLMKAPGLTPATKTHQLKRSSPTKSIRVQLRFHGFTWCSHQILGHESQTPRLWPGFMTWPWWSRNCEQPARLLWM